MSPELRSLLAGLGIALTILLLVAGAVGASRPLLVLLMMMGVIGTVLTVARLLPAATELNTTLATCIAIYTVSFAGGVIALFHHAHWLGVVAAFVLPLLGFVGGVARQRSAIRARLADRRPSRRQQIVARGMIWLCLCFLIGILTVATISPGENVVRATGSLVGAMTLISASVIWFAADIACLLDETGALFHLFLARMKARIVPIFSFLVVFLFIGVVFATLYALLDHSGTEPAFAVGGASTRLTLPDAIYFSFVTLSTIGYGDITPLDPLARVLVIAEIIFGVVLLLFAFSEIAAYNPDADEAVEPRDDDR